MRSTDVRIFHRGTGQGAGGDAATAGGRVLRSPGSGRPCPRRARQAPRRASGLRSKARPGDATSLGASAGVPELPEVGDDVRERGPATRGCQIAQVRLRKTDVLGRSRVAPHQHVIGTHIEQVSRRAKHAVFRLSSEHRMIIQPRMTGSFLVHDKPLTRHEAKYAVCCTLS